MKLVTLDFETYYDTKIGYSLSKRDVSTEMYVNDPRFEFIGVSAMIDDGPCDWFSGTIAQAKEWLYQYDLWGSAVAAHNMLFDGLILQRHFGIVPKLYVDTLSMARPLLGSRVKSLSLASLVKHYGLGEKGDEVIRADGMRLADFSPAALAAYGDYCIKDTMLTRMLYKKQRSEMSRLNIVASDELRAIDQTLRMYMVPSLRLDRKRLGDNLKIVQEKKAKALADLEVQGVTKATLRSNDKFAELLRSRGIEPPMKLSPAALKKGEHKMTYAFAKADPEFIELQEEFADDIEMTMLLNGRISEKSTQEESRTNKFIKMHDLFGGFLRVPLAYAHAHTLRYGGIEGYNMQNPPRVDKSPMRFAIVPPEGYSMIVSDLSQIEARIVALIAGQMDLVEAFARGEDVYSTYACELFGLPPGSISKALAKGNLVIENQRKVGKESILGLGFNMGAPKFQRALRGKAGLTVSLETCEDYVGFYRNKKYPKIPTLWRRVEYAFKDLMATGEETQIGPIRIAMTDGIPTIIGPTGTRLWYPGLKFKDGQWTCKLARDLFPRNMFGGKWTENLVQFLANIVIKQKMIRVQQELDLWAKLQAHDAVGWVVVTGLAKEYAAKIDTIMKARVSWWPELPIDAETKVGLTYGNC